MSHEFLLWIALSFYSVHILEEYNYDWKSWVNSISPISVDWSSFYITNFVVIVFGFCCAQIGWKLPEFSMIYISLMWINAVFFHILPTIYFRKFSPGLFTAIFLFLPIVVWCYYGAYMDGKLSTQVLILSNLGGVVVMIFPVILAKTKNHRLITNKSN
jgi:hypothetical protein